MSNFLLFEKLDFMLLPSVIKELDIHLKGFITTFDKLLIILFSLPANKKEEHIIAITIANIQNIILFLYPYDFDTHFHQKNSRHITIHKEPHKIVPSHGFLSS